MKALFGYTIDDDDEYEVGDNDGFDEVDVLENAAETDADEADPPIVEESDEPPDLVEELASASHEWDDDDDVDEDEEL